ncbi:solute carrier family 25 (mitochondrial folate transporter), member 32 [Marchantia polymorpha subsp. ruderalis]|uniref:Uncharacterized protein n=2 Tax=Marchantia polymorpha TaxID=3197 RepID=A0A176WGD1_MARPO|nr:hypothetical protein AXG93_3384s1250 [Marchantia polymorpha subsp. ruderalis]PTQ45319.1 hypothetical protein MARPO_0015s0117 [Marchantia polymorpha]BBN01553.1 hypothetical protein Mp_2g08320 [Marchantia polymorpha subsp. ruderalis]|eukprot:PTQ45319.1 hypothetical protein MARPO_0015s0117 [Marchantia polymorpha]
MSSWQWENATAGAVAGFATVVSLHPLDIVRTRFQVNDGRNASIPSYKSTIHALSTIGRIEGLRGLYAGLTPALIGSSVSWGAYFLFYSNAKARYQGMVNGELGPVLHLISAVEAGSLVCLVTNPLWLVKTRLQLQAPGHGTQKPYTGVADALRSIVREEGLRGLYKGLGPGLLLVSHGALQFMAYEEMQKFLLASRSKRVPDHDSDGAAPKLASVDFAVLGAASKIFALFCTYPYSVVRSRIQQRPDDKGVASYVGGWQALKKTFRYEGVRGLYKGLSPALIRTVPSSSITFVVYESVLKFLK